MGSSRSTDKQKWRERDERLRVARQELNALTEQWRLPLPWGPYRAAPFTCWKCDERIIVYAWVGHEALAPDQPPAPRPWTLKQRITRQSGGANYWANTCAKCKSTIGDNYLYAEPDKDGPPPFQFTWTKLPAVPGGPLPWGSTTYSRADSFANPIAFIAARVAGYRG
jgi:hypothetical protein